MPDDPNTQNLLPPPAARSFTQTIEALRYGHTAGELDDALRDLTRAVQDREKVGKITITLTLKPGKGGQIEIFDEWKATPPKPERSSTIMFATTEGHLSRQDPRQRELPGLRNVNDGPAEPARRVG